MIIPLANKSISRKILWNKIFETLLNFQMCARINKFKKEQKKTFLKIQFYNFLCKNLFQENMDETGWFDFFTLTPPWEFRPLANGCKGMQGVDTQGAVCVFFMGKHHSFKILLFISSFTHFQYDKYRGLKSSDLRDRTMDYKLIMVLSHQI